MSRLLAALVVAPFVMGFATLPHPPRHVVLTYQDPRIVEASGLVARGGLFTTVNDSGDAGRVFTVDRTGRTVGVTSWTPDPDDPVDDEALAPLPHGRVLVGDIGDNLAARDSVRLRAVPVGRGDRTVTPTTYDLTYPGGAIDAETLLVQPGTGRVLIVTKSFFGGTVLEAPRHLRTDRPNPVRAVGSAIAVATDGAFFPDGRHLVVRDYARAVVYSYPGLEPVGRFTLPQQPQGEGIAVDPHGRVFVTSEGAHAAVLRVRLPAALQRVVVPPPVADDATPPAATPTPAAPAPARAPDDGGRSPWPWLLGGGIGLAAVVVLVRSLRPR